MHRLRVDLNRQRSGWLLYHWPLQLRVGVGLPELTVDLRVFVFGWIGIALGAHLVLGAGVRRVVRVVVQPEALHPVGEECLLVAPHGHLVELTKEIVKGTFLRRARVH